MRPNIRGDRLVSVFPFASALWWPLTLSYIKTSFFIFSQFIRAVTFQFIDHNNRFTSSFLQYIFSRRLVFLFLVSLGGVRLSPLGTSATVGLLYQPRMIDDNYGAVGKMRIGRGNRSTGGKPAPVPLCPPQIPHDLGSNPGRRGGKPATNRLSYGTA
jgi:hypothetical protein